MRDSLKINKNTLTRIVTVDDFYDDPISVREKALELEFYRDDSLFHGQRTYERFAESHIRDAFSSLLGTSVTRWDEHAMNGVFQLCTASDPLVYHADMQRWAGIIYLSPDASPTTGTSFYQHLRSDSRSVRDGDPANIFAGGYFDGTRFREIDRIGNVFNRLVLFDAGLIHAASAYCGEQSADARLFQMFFFD